MKRPFIIAALLAILSLTGAMAVSAQNTGTAIITAYHLNVRDYPDPTIGNVIARVGRNEVYPVTGRSPFNNWWQIRLPDGRLGWANGGYMQIYDAHLVPVINPSTVPGPAPVGSFGTVTTSQLNVRDIPNWITGVVIARITRNETYPVVGRNANSSWWQIRLGDGRLGWVNGRYLSVTNPQLVPQTDNTVPPSPTSAVGTVTANFLNVRSVPNSFSGAIIGVIGRGQSYEVIGRTADFSWWQIRFGGTTGWVSDAYLSVINAHLVPITS
jgi:uncharacterized protein YgiM (DUF1202 family)